MATTVYVDLDVGTASGTGTTGDPYGTLIYALAQEDTTADDVTYKLRATSAFSTSEIAVNTTSNTSVTIEPDDGYGFSSGAPQIVIYQSTNNVYVFNITQANVTIRGLQLEHRRYGSGWLPPIKVGTVNTNTIVVENCFLIGNGGGILCATGYNAYVTVQNCFITHYTDNTTLGFTGIDVAGNSNVRAYNNVLVGPSNSDTGIDVSATGDETNTIVKNNVFIGFAANSEFIETGGQSTESNNATDQSSSSVLTTAVTSVVAGDFESASFTNPRTAGMDFRLASGNTNLNDEGVAISGLTTDAFGTTYDDPPPIGYHQLASSGGIIPLAKYHYSHNTGSGL